MVFVGLVLNACLYVSMAVVALWHSYPYVGTVCYTELWVYVLVMLCRVWLSILVPPSRWSMGVLAYVGIVALAYESADETCDVLRSAGVVTVVLNIFIVILLSE